MDNQQISLVTQERKERARLLLVFFHAGEHGCGSIEDVLLIRCAETAPGGPAHAKHLVQNIRAIQCQRDGWWPAFLRLLFLMLHSVTNTADLSRRAELALTFYPSCGEPVGAG